MKKLFLVPIFLLLLLGCKEPVINLTVPENYKINEPVILDASTSIADKLQWIIHPKPNNFETTSNGKIAYFIPTEPVDYTIILIADNSITKQFTLSPVFLPLTEFENKVQLWLGDLSDSKNRGAALRLAQSFKTVAIAIDKDIFETVDGLILATARSNSNALNEDLETWKPFLQQFQKYLETNPPYTIKEHIPVWLKMADALEKIFGTPC